MKPALVADEMFPEGAGPFMELEDVRIDLHSISNMSIDLKLKYSHAESRWLSSRNGSGGNDIHMILAYNSYIP